ncbi:MAG: hypothetical protein KIY11_09555 [Thermoplasmata archaeon]|nr:hypothetical protein [Candidatus Sysuiplasma acidicola]MBX8638582.1 hypothetical protein [Candidatus Sysuiplasma acidicola]
MTSKRVISADEKMTILNEGMLPGTNVREISIYKNKEGQGGSDTLDE